MINNVKIELCANTIDDVLIASKYPFDTIELNSGTEIDGLTPSISFLTLAKRICSAKMQVMIRPRAGGFCYSAELYEQMKSDLRSFLENGADGIVFGFTTQNGSIDKDRTREFTEIIHSYGKTATFHKAIDVICELDDALEFLKTIGIDRILTAPGNFSKISIQCPNIEIIAGGGVKSENVNDLLANDINHLHFTAKKTVFESFGSYYATDEQEIINIITKIRKG